jgi:hypothetical protein
VDNKARGSAYETTESVHQDRRGADATDDILPMVTWSSSEEVRSRGS